MGQPISPSAAARLGLAQAEADALEGVAREIINTICEELDELVRKVRRWLDQEDEINDYDLQRLAIRIPTVLYDVSTGLVRATLEVQVATLLADGVFNREFVDRAGNVADRKADAEVYAEDATRAVLLVKYIEREIKGKMDQAEKLYEGIKKIMTSRDTERQVFGSEHKRK